MSWQQSYLKSALLLGVIVPAILFAVVIVAYFVSPTIPAAWITFTLGSLALLYAVLTAAFIVRTKLWDRLGAALTFQSYVAFLIWTWFFIPRFFAPIDQVWRNAILWTLSIVINAMVLWVIVEVERLPPRTRIDREGGR